MPILAFAQAPTPVREFAPLDIDEALTFDLRRDTPDGEDIFPLDGPYRLQLGVDGLDDVPITLATSRPAGWDGDTVNDITAEAVESFLPMLIEGGSLEGLRAAKRALADFTNPRKGPVRLRVTRPDGQYRERLGLRTRMVSGGLDAETWGVSWQKVGPVLHHSDPFWTEPTTAWHVTWSVRPSSSSPLPILPLAPGAAQALGDTNDVTVRGDVETFPVWKITGPFSQVKVRDEGRGLQWILTAAAGPGDVWTVDCRKGRQAVYAPNGTWSRGNLSNDAYLWGLVPGVSRISTTVLGGTVGTSVAGDAPSRWESY